MMVYRDRGTVVAVTAGLVLVTGVALAIAGSAGSLSGWGVWVGAALAVVIGLGVLSRVRNTTTTVDTGSRRITVEVRPLPGSGKTETIPFEAIGSIVGRHIELDEEYPEHALVLVLTDGTRRTLASHMSPERVDLVRAEIRALLES